jgi:hypothetical protein
MLIVYIAAMPLISKPTASNAPLLNPLVAVRGFPLIATFLLAMAMVFTKHESIRSVCLGGAFGVLLGYTVFSFGIRAVALKLPGQATGPQRYPFA